MNPIAVDGPFDFKVYGALNAFTSRTTEFLIASDTTQIEEILIISPSDGHSSCDVNSKQIDGNISIEFQPEEIGLHEIRIFSDKNNRDLFNSFKLNVYDSSRLKINLLDEEAIVGKLFKFTVLCEDIGEGSLNVNIEQEDRQLKPTVKQLPNDLIVTSSNLYYYYYEISFVPESETPCRIEIEFIDNLERLVYGDTFKINVKCIDFIVFPFPLIPFAVNKKSSFNLKCLRDGVQNLKVVIKTSNENTIESDLVKLEQNYYEIKFTPKLIERHIVEIFFDDEIINSDRYIKIDVFDVNQIKVKMPNSILLGEMNTFLVDTTDAGEGNLEVVIKDGYDTLKAQLLRRDKRKFIIGFNCDRNMKHEIHVIFNDIQIKESPFFISPDMVCSKSLEMLGNELASTNTNNINNSDAVISNQYKAVEGGPLDGIQCGEKMWVIFDTQSPPYFDVQFLVTDENNMAIKHTKIQEEGGRWCIEFIPLSMGLHLIQRVLMIDEKPQVHLLHKVNVFNYSSHRIVYGYKLYNIQDSVQLVFDAANFNLDNIVPEITNHNAEECEIDECKYLTDYLALKFNPESPGGYIVNFIDKISKQKLASSPYKIIVHENLKEIVKSSGIYDVTRLTIISSYLPDPYEFNDLKIEVYDPHDINIKNCYFQNNKKNLIIEFISRIEGIHKVFLYLNEKLIYDNPFLIYINGDCYTANSISGVLSPFYNFNASSIGFTNPRTNNTNNNNNNNNNNNQARLSLSRHVSLNQGYYQASAYGHGSIYCLKLNEIFHFVLNDQNLKGLTVLDSLNEPIEYELNVDNHENHSVIFKPLIEGTHKIVGLVEGREIEVQLFVLENHVYESLFEMKKYNEYENIIEKPFIIRLKEQNLEVDAYDPLGERVDVRYSTDNLASFIPHTSGYHRIYVSDYHGPILGSPFYALIFPNTELNFSGHAYVESSGIRDSIRNEKSTFIIRDTDLNIDVQIKSPNSDILKINKTRNANNHLQITYTPELIGPHEILILKNGIKSIGSPVTVYVSDPSLVKINNLKYKSKVGEAFSFDIDAIDAGEGFIRVNIKDSKMNDLLPEIIEFDDRKYLVQIMPNNPGVYVFSLTFNKYHVIESPFKVIITDEELFTSSNLDNNNKSDYIEQQSQPPPAPSNQHIADSSTSSAEKYEINNLNQFKTDKSLKKLDVKMEVETLDATNEQNRLTPIMDTSEESSSDEPVYKGEGFIEKVEKLNDGSSNLLLHIGNESDLSNSSDPNIIKGKYKYRLKRIGRANPYDQTTTKDTNGSPKAKHIKLNNKNNDENQILKSKSKELVASIVDNSINKMKTTSNEKSSKLADNLPSVSDKKKLFEITSTLSTTPGNSNKKPLKDEAATSSHKQNKVQDFVNQLNKSDGNKPATLLEDKNTKSSSETNQNSNNNNNNKKIKKDQSFSNFKSTKQSPKSGGKNETNNSKNNNDKAKENNDNNQGNEEDMNEDDEDDEINVVNESIVTKLTKENQKKIDQNKTVVVEEKFVISSVTPETTPSTTPKNKNKQNRPRSKSKQKDIGETKNDISRIKSNKDHHLVEREEKSKSFIDKVTKVTNETKSGKDKPSEKEIIVKRTHIEPNLISSESLKEIGDERIVEQFKPEETIQYEYEQVIEQPDSSQSYSQQQSSGRLPSNNSKNSKKVENIETKTIQSETKEIFKKIENIGDEQVKTTTTDLTTYITEEIEDKLTETLENSKNIHEFSYVQRKIKNKPNDSAIDLDKDTQLLEEEQEEVEEMIIEQKVEDIEEADNNVQITTVEFNFSHQPILYSNNSGSDSNSSLPKLSSQSGENQESGSREAVSSGAESGSEDTGILKKGIGHRIGGNKKMTIFESDLNSAKSYNHSGSGENLFDYYKLNKVPSNDKFEDRKVVLKSVDVNSLEHGENFKAYETISSDDSLNKNITHKTSEITRKEHHHHEDSANDETIAESDYDGEPKSLESLLKLKDTRLNTGMSLATPHSHYTNINIRTNNNNNNNIIESEIESIKNKSSDSDNNNASISNNEGGESDESGNELKTNKEQIKYFYQPIEKMTAEDFYENDSIIGDVDNSNVTIKPDMNIPISNKSSNINTQPKSNLDELKSKFERKETKLDEQLKRAKPEDQKSFNLKDGKSTPAKLPKSKVEIYDNTQKKSELTSNDDDNNNNNNNKSSNNTKKARFNNKPANDEKLATEVSVTAKPDKIKLGSRMTAAEKPKEKNEFTEIEEKRSKLRKTLHTYPIEDEPNDTSTSIIKEDQLKIHDETANKHSSEDEFSIFKRPKKSSTENSKSDQKPIQMKFPDLKPVQTNKQDPVLIESNNEPIKIDKGVKSLLNVYEKKSDSNTPQINSNNNNNKLVSSKSKLEEPAENIKKLSKSTVNIFESEKPTPSPPSSSKTNEENRQSNLLSKKDESNLKPSSFLKSTPFEKQQQQNEPLPSSNESAQKKIENEEPKKLSKTKLEIYEQKNEEESAKTGATVAKTTLSKLSNNSQEKIKKNETERTSTDKLSKSSSASSQKNLSDKIKEPSLDKLKKSDKIDKTDKPTEHLKSDRLNKSISSKQLVEDKETTSNVIVEDVVTEEFGPKSVKKLLNKYETKPSQSHNDDRFDEKTNKKKSKLSCLSSSSESSRYSDIKSSSSDVNLDKLKPSADDKSIKQLIGKYDQQTSSGSISQKDKGIKEPDIKLTKPTSTSTPITPAAIVNIHESQSQFKHANQKSNIINNQENLVAQSSKQKEQKQPVSILKSESKYSEPKSETTSKSESVTIQPVKHIVLDNVTKEPKPISILKLENSSQSKYQSESKSLTSLKDERSFNSNSSESLMKSSKSESKSINKKNADKHIEQKAVVKTNQEAPVQQTKYYEQKSATSASATPESSFQAKYFDQKPVSILNPDTSFQSKYPDLNIVTETDLKTEKAIQKLVDIYAQKNGTPCGNRQENDPLQPIYYDFPSYYNFPSNITGGGVVSATPVYNQSSMEFPNYDYNSQANMSPSLSEYIYVEKPRPYLEVIKEVDSKSDNFDETYEDQYYEDETDKDFGSKKENQLGSTYEESNQFNTSSLADTTRTETITTETITNSNTNNQEKSLTAANIYKTGNSDLTAIVHLTNPKSNSIIKSQNKSKEETEDNSKLLEKKQNPNRNDKENKPTRLNESEKVVSQEDKSLNKQEILSLKDNLKDTSKNMSKDENTFLNVNEYFRDLSKNSNTKASRNSSLEPTNPIEVQLEVEYKKPLEFSVKKSRDKQNVEYKSLAEFNDRQIIRFNYRTVVDFTIGVKNKSSVASFYGDEYSDQNLKAEIEITVFGDFVFQIIRKDNRKPIEINVLPKMNNTYRIQFQPSPVTSYILKALPITTN